ncbi:MAG: hypothetical protein JNM55_17765 [Anaerolineales bacterium]|nr:hypothetical protein [Anaerolineales bacterium]
MDELKIQHAIKIKPTRIALSLLSVSLVIMLLSLLGQRFRFFGGYSISGPVQEYFLDTFIFEFFINNEGNIATFWNTLLLIITSALAFVIASAKFSQKDKYRFEWLLLGLVFLYLSMDESAIIHEKFSILLKNMPDVNGWAHYKWIYAGAAAVLLLMVMFIRFYLHLDLRNKILFPVAMSLYLGGAFGGELFSGHYAQANGTKNIVYMLMTHGEELGEHIGIILMIFTLLTYLVRNYSKIGLTTRSVNNTAEDSHHIIKIDPAKSIIVFFSVSLTIVIFSLLGQREYYTGNPTEKFFRELFTTEFFVNNSENIATYWNMLLLTIMSVSAFAIASIKRVQKSKYKHEWLGLGIMFSYFAMDELSGVTHRFAKLLKDLPTMEGGFLYNWFYPVAAVIIILVLVFFIWFTLRLDMQKKYLFPISIVLYAMGAFRAELFSGRYAEMYGTTTTSYLYLTHVEEFVEYIGITLMIYLLFTYFSTLVSEIEFTSQELGPK